MVPREGATYTRITLLAIESGTGLPSVTEGVDRLVATHAFDGGGAAVRRYALVAVVLASLLVGCSDDDGDGDAGASSTTSSTATSWIDGDQPRRPRAPTTSCSTGRATTSPPTTPTRASTASSSRTPTPTRRTGATSTARSASSPTTPGRFIAGEDTGQPNPPAGWGIFEVSGATLDDLSVEQVGKLTPTYQTENPENIGCGFLSDGRFVTSAPGNQVNGPPDGELIMWFPPIEGTEVPFCKIDVTLGTAGTIYVDDDDNIYIASARGDPGVYRFSGPFPTSADAAGGCGKTDPTGAPMADEVQRELFIPSRTPRCRRRSR